MSECQDPQHRRAETKRRIKALQKQRKALPAEDRTTRASISAELKTLKKELHRVESEINQSSEDSAGQPDSQPAVRADFADPFTVVSEWPVNDWDPFCANNGGTLYHRSAWRDILAHTMRRELFYLTARSADQKLIGALPLAITRSRLFGHYAVSLPYFNYGGPVAVAPNVEQALIEAAFELCASQGLHQVEIRDTVQRSGLVARTDKVSMRLDLSGVSALTGLLDQRGSKLRAQVNKAMSSGVSFKVGGTALLGDFYRVFATNMRDLGTPVYQADFFASILDTFTDDTLLVVGYFNQAPVCGAFLARNGNAWEIPWASTLRKANAIAANMALYGRVLEEVIERNATLFDFGRSSVDAPTYRFKKQWGATPMPLYWYNAKPEGATDLTVASPKFRMAIAAWKKLPVAVTRVVGPPLVRNLP